MQVRRKKINFKRMRPRRRRDRRKPTTKSAKECDAFLFFISSSLCLFGFSWSLESSEATKKKRRHFVLHNSKYPIQNSKSHVKSISSDTVARTEDVCKNLRRKRRDKTYPPFSLRHNRRRRTTLLSFYGTPTSSLISLNVILWAHGHLFLRREFLKRERETQNTKNTD